jgi:hypothetical protein
VIQPQSGTEYGVSDYLFRLPKGEENVKPFFSTLLVLLPIQEERKTDLPGKTGVSLQKGVKRGASPS